MIALYYYPGNASLLPHMVLREAGATFDLRLVDREKQAHKHPDYLKLNPNGRIPALTDEDLVLYETAAIVFHLCDKFPAAGLAPPLGSPERAHFYKWMVHLSNTPQVEFLSWFYPHEHTAEEGGIPGVKQAAGERLEAMFDRISEQLGEKQWLLGDHFSAADLFLFMLIRWSRGMPRPARNLANLRALADRVAARPAVREALDAEGIKAPYF